MADSKAPYVMPDTLASDVIESPKLMIDFETLYAKACKHICALELLLKKGFTSFFENHEFIQEYDDKMS